MIIAYLIWQYWFYLKTIFWIIVMLPMLGLIYRLVWQWFILGKTMTFMHFIKHLCWSYGKFILCIAVILITLALIWTLVWPLVVYRPLMEKKFNSAEWKLVEYHCTRPPFRSMRERCGMYHDLTRNHLKKGMSIKDIENLLGGPIRYWHYCKDKQIKCAIYFMGTCFSILGKGVNADLYTCFNRAGRLITYDRAEHCNTKGSYNVLTKEQECYKKNQDGILARSNDCGIDDPW